MKNYEQLILLQQEAKLYESIREILDWDQNCFMPPKAASYRGRQMGKIAQVAHELQTSSAYERALEGAAREVASLAADDPRRVNVVKASRQYRRQKQLPSKLVEELADAAVSTHALWEQARVKRDFSVMKSGLIRTVGLLREKAECIGYEQHPYNALLPDFEWGPSVAGLDLLFAPLKEDLTALVQKCAQKRSGELVDLGKYHYPKEQQARIAEELAVQLGFSFEDGVLTTSSHPFSTTLGMDDYRITTRYHEQDFLTGFFAVAHEVGHSLYERGLPREHFDIPIGRACSAGIHESQSLFWEARIASSQAFLSRWFPRFRELFPELPAGLTPMALYQAANRVTPSLIRIDADEVTYPLHIIIRYEIEKGLMTGEYAVGDIPDIWNSKYQSHLVAPRNDAEGCLQDIHWSLGLFGYFPSYALGHLFSAQFAEQMEKDLGPLDGLVAQGRLPAILGWLNANIHRHGAVYDSYELVEKVTGAAVSHQPFLNYLHRKYREIYQF